MHKRVALLFSCGNIYLPMKKQTQAIDVLVNLVDWLMTNDRASLAPAFDALKLDADTVFSAFDFAYGEDEGEDSKEHLVSLANVGRELRSMGIDFED
jgi:hypothetical protein